MYHILTALLFRTGIKSENHSVSIILLKKIYGIDNSKISYYKKERIDKQYYVDFKITKEEVEDSIKNAEIFNNKIIDFISKLRNQEIKKYRDNFITIIK
jgi:uncharacterized protein (UPF0332 family)